MLYRKIDEKLELWSKTKYALIVFGARQVGKTFSIRNFLNRSFGHYLEINLHENVTAIKTILKSKDVDDFLLRLSVFDKTGRYEEDTPIFIDEIQEYYSYLEKHKEIDEYFDIISESKYIVQKTKHRFVMSGSLLRLEMNDLITNPVGYLLPLRMYPMDFEEFMISNGIQGNIIEIARNCFTEKKEVPDFIHEKLLDLYLKYILVGGMPNAVNEFIEKKSFTYVGLAHKTIDHFINEDITKYAVDNEKLKIKEIYKLIPTELQNPSRKFILSDIPGHSKNDNEFLSFAWLEKAGVVIEAHISSEPVFPLKASSKRNQLKLFHEDVGILGHLVLNDESKADVLNGSVKVNLGYIYENAVAQTLYAHGFDELYYYNSKKYGEVDFLVEKGSKVIPIEVKSGKTYTHRALNSIMDIENYGLDEAIVFHNGNVKILGKLTYYPIYLSTFMGKV